ncbi:dipeptidase [Cesiribacter andamanensis]|nr:dipeptidase [Cesiribacter andamanensis]
MKTTSQSAHQTYIKQHQDRFLGELFDLLRIPSVSADPKFAPDVRRAAEYIRQRLLEAGADSATIHETNGHPIVYGERIQDPALPTVLVYGHYDVQPADPYELWDSPPFEPVVRQTKEHPEGAIFARGACDDKGQAYMHVKAFETMMQSGTLPCNVKFMIEGEEEVGSDNLEIFVQNNKDLLAADVILISDTGIISNTTPSITVGLRGMSYVEVEVVGPNRDLHSGRYGGAVANPINVLCNMIARLHDEKGRITIPGFYDKVTNLSLDDRKAMHEVPHNDDEFAADLGVDGLQGEEGYTTIERVGIRPTLDVNGIWGGYIGEGAKTVLPSKAYAKISMRLVPDQNSDEVTDMFAKHFLSLAPKGVKVAVRPHHGGEPAVIPTDSLEYRAASAAFEECWGKAPVPTRDGGSIPIVSLFQRELGLDSVLLGFGLDSDNIHSPNEKYGVFNYLKGIETIASFYQHYAGMKK